MTGSLDEASAGYGLIAEAVKHAADYSSVSFRLNKNAKFSDGSPITADDVAFSLTALKKAHPFTAPITLMWSAMKLPSHEIPFASGKGQSRIADDFGAITDIEKSLLECEGRSLAETSLDIPPVRAHMKSRKLDAGRASPISAVLIIGPKI